MALKGSICVPGDKSISHRALMFSALCGGESTITGLANNKDVAATLGCIEALGAVVTETEAGLRILGKQPWEKPAGVLQAENSGTTMRLLSGLLAAQAFESTITGDASLCRRPMGRIIEPLGEMGALIQSNAGHAPLIIRPATHVLKGIDYTLPHASAQIKSAILLAGLYAEGETRITEFFKSRDHTERMLRHLGIELREEENTIILPGQQISRLANAHADWHVPGDVSSAAFWIVAALLVPGSAIRIRNVLLNPYRTGIIKVLKSVGANIQTENEHDAGGEPVGDLVVSASELTGNISLSGEDIPALIDELPILAMAAVFLNGTLTVRGASELRVKESDRIDAIATELGKVGIPVEAFPDGFSISGCPERVLAEPREQLDSHYDHRIAMSLRILNTVSHPNTRWDIMGEQHIAVSYPDFHDTLEQLRQ